MNELQIKEFAKLINEDSKVAIINLLMDGGFHTVNELAKAAKIRPHTASYHLKKMQGLGLLKMKKYGRFHYYQLMNQEFAQFFETIGAISPVKPVRYLSQQMEAKKMYEGRTCYDHLAGKLGVKVTQYLLTQNYLNDRDGKISITTRGEQFFKEQGIDLLELKKQKRHFCIMCLDWSERQHHVAGSIGHALYLLFLNRQWIVNSEKSRAVSLTDKGKKEIKEEWGLDLG